MRLRFDEPVRALGGMQVVRNFGPSVLARKAARAGRDLVLPLKRIGDGDYTVLWRVLSDDGHVETGVLAFGVGAGRGAAGALAQSRAGRSRRATSSSRFLVFAGLLLVAGRRCSGSLVWRVVAPRGSGPRTSSRCSSAGSSRSSSARSGLTGHGLPFTRFGIAYGALIALAVCGAVAAAISAPIRPCAASRSALALAIVPLPSIAGTRSRTGACARLSSSSTRAPARRERLARGDRVAPPLAARARAASARIGSRGASPLVALDAVVLLGVTGVARALGELRAFHQLWTTSYGVAILVKSGLFAALVVVGAINRRGSSRLARAAGFRRALRLELVLLSAAVGAVAFLTDARPGPDDRPGCARPRPPPLALPPPGASSSPRRQRDLALGFALRPAGRRRADARRRSARSAAASTASVRGSASSAAPAPPRPLRRRLLPRHGGVPAGRARRPSSCDGQGKVTPRRRSSSRAPQAPAGGRRSSQQPRAATTRCARSRSTSG